jgi:hypothetical protein
MRNFPETDRSLVIRTDYSDDVQWQLICNVITDPKNEFDAFVIFLQDEQYNCLSIADLPRFPVDQSAQTFVLIVDDDTCADDEYPILCVDLNDDFGRSFRVVPNQVWSITCNLSIANMDFSEFADNVDADGVFRGFKG